MFLPTTISALDKIYEKNNRFRHWVIGIKEQWLWKNKNKQVEPYDFLFIVWREFPGHRTGRGNPNRTLKSPWIEDIEVRFSGDETLRIYRVGPCELWEERIAWRRELHTEGRVAPRASSGDFIILPSRCLLSIDQHISMSK